MHFTSPLTTIGSGGIFVYSRLSVNTNFACHKIQGSQQM